MTEWAQAGANAAGTSYQGGETMGTSYSAAWRYQHQITPTVPETLWPQHQPIVSASKVLVGTQMGTLRAFVAGAGGGAVSWAASVGAPIFGSGCSDGTTYFCSDGYGRITAYTISTGAVLWGPRQITDGLPFVASLKYADSLLLIGGADGTFYGVDPADGSVSWSYDVGAPILMTAAANGAGKVVFGAQNMKVYCLNTSTGALIWSTSALAGSAFKDYWPVIVGTKVYIRPQAKYGLPAGGVPSTPLRAIEVDDWTDSSAMGTALSAYAASPSSYARTLYVLGLSDGADTAGNQVIHWNFVITQHGASPPPCLDKDGYLIIPAPKPVDGFPFGWVRLDLSTRKIHDGLVDGSGYVAGHGWQNRDENVAVSACSNGILAMHCQEGNAQTTGFFQQTGGGSPLWHAFGGAGTSRLLTNTQGGGAALAAISGGLAYHLSEPHTLVAWQAS